MLKQRAILRSIYSNSNDKKEIEYLLENFNLALRSEVTFSLEHHSKIFSYIKKHVSKTVDIPSYQRLFKEFEEDSDIIAELEKINTEKPLFANNFKSLLEDILEEQYARDLTQILKETNEICTTGKKIGKDFVRGVKPSIDYLQNKAISLIKVNSLVKINGHTHGESQEAVREYYENKKLNIFDGLLSGIDTIDLSCKGIRPSELWLIVAYVGELKTTMAMNFAYSQAVDQKKNVKFISLEMPYKVVRNIFITIHSANLDLWPGSVWDDVYPLRYEDIMDGTLSEREERFFEFLAKDLDNNQDYGDIHIYQPPDGLTCSQLKSWAEMEYRKTPFDAIYLDYIELMKDDFDEKGQDYGTKLNQRIKNLKQFALNFNGGRGTRLISAYQANRKGKEMADKSDGAYRLDALSYANEAERSADVIIYSYLNDELRANNQNKIGCLKNRTRAPFRQFKAKTNLSCRKIYETASSGEIAAEEQLRNNTKQKISKDELITGIV